MPPVNNTCASALTITFPYRRTFDVTGATQSPDDPASSEFGGVPEESVWFTFMPETAGYVEILAAGSTYEPILTLYTGTCGGAWTEIAASSSSGVGDGRARLVFQPTTGQTYHLVASSWTIGDAASLTLTAWQWAVGVTPGRRHVTAGMASSLERWNGPTGSPGNKTIVQLQADTGYAASIEASGNIGDAAPTVSGTHETEVRVRYGASVSAGIGGVYIRGMQTRPDGEPATIYYPPLQTFEIELQLSSAPGVSDGEVRAYIGGVQVFEATGLDTSTTAEDSIDRARVYPTGYTTAFYAANGGPVAGFGLPAVPKSPTSGKFEVWPPAPAGHDATGALSFIDVQAFATAAEITAAGWTGATATGVSFNGPPATAEPGNGGTPPQAGSVGGVEIGTLYANYDRVLSYAVPLAEPATTAVQMTIDNSIPCCAPPGRGGKGTRRGATGDLLRPVSAAWTPRCDGGGAVPAAPDLTDSEDWSA